MYFFKTILFAVLAVQLPVFAAPTAPCPEDGKAQLLTQFPNGSWVENLAVRSDNQILVGLVLPKPQLYTVDPAKPGSKPALVYTFPNATSVFGIAETQPDVFQVIAGRFDLKNGFTKGSSSVWTVDFSRNKAKPQISLLTAVPQAGGLNGMCVVPQDRNIVLMSDITGGTVLRLDTKTKKITTAVPSDNILTEVAPAPGLGNVGANGVHIRGDQLFIANTGKGTFGSIDIQRDGTLAPNAKPKVLQKAAAGTQEDDFALDEKNAFLVTGSGNTVIKLSPDGKQTTLAGNLNSTEVAEPTSAVLSRTGKKTLFVSTAGGLGAPIGGKKIVGGQVLAIEI